MQKQSVVALALAGASFLPSLVSAQYASSVVSYTPGTGVNASYTTPAVALGAPTTFIGYQNADVFNPAYDSIHLVSVGVGGSLTVQFNTPIFNQLDNPYGIDFQIFGNTGFTVTNVFDLETFQYIGTPATDGALFGNNTGATRVSVSADGVNFYALNPSLAPVADGMFPLDAAGDPTKPVNPALKPGDFAGLTGEQIRALYSGSGGGTGYDIAWAQDGNGGSVVLGSISYVRLEVLSGKSDVDAIVAVVPEPATWSLAGLGGVAWLAVRRRRNAAVGSAK